MHAGPKRCGSISIAEHLFGRVHVLVAVGPELPLAGASAELLLGPVADRREPGAANASCRHKNSRPEVCVCVCENFKQGPLGGHHLHEDVCPPTIR